jgi:hypothetical protein
MTELFRFFFQPAAGPPSLFLIRTPVGLIFLSQGILKFIDPNMGSCDLRALAFRTRTSRRTLSAALKSFAAASLFWDSGPARHLFPC